MNSIIFTGVLSIITTLVAPQLSADDPGGGRGHRDKAERMCQQLECSEQQQARIQSIRAEHREQMADERARAKQLHAALRAERSAESPDAQRVQTLRAELSALRDQMKADRRDERAEVSAVLTPPQREKLEALKAERKAKRKGDRKGNGKAKRRGEHRGKKVGAWTGGKRGERDKAQAQGAKGARDQARVRGQGKGRDMTKVDRKRVRRGKAQPQGKAFAGRERKARASSLG